MKLARNTPMNIWINMDVNKIMEKIRRRKTVKYIRTTFDLIIKAAKHCRQGRLQQTVTRRKYNYTMCSG